MTSIFFGIASRSFHYDKTVGRSEYAGEGFRVPADIALGQNGSIYVPNRSLDWRPDGVRVTVLTVDDEFIGQFSQFGDGDGDLWWPTSIALDSSQNVYVADEWLNRISIFDQSGGYLGKWGTPGTGEGEISKPACIRFDKSDNLYLVDSANSRVQVFTKEGKFLASWGEAGTGPGQFNLPWGMAIDNAGDVYVADWRNDRIQKLTADGKFLAEFGSPGSGVGEFNRPTGVAVDKDGDIYVADWLNDRVQVFTADGKHITTFTGDGGLSKWATQKMNANPDMMKMRSLIRDRSGEMRFWRPKAIAIDDEGRVIVVDSARDRLQVYQKDNYYSVSPETNIIDTAG